MGFRSPLLDHKLGHFDEAGPEDGSGEGAALAAAGPTLEEPVAGD
jgi:hypothetical protein